MNATAINTKNQRIYNDDKISRRELQVLELIAYEYTAKEIAEQLFVSIHTVVAHRKNLMEKWQVRNSAGLVRKGFEQGVLKIRTL